MNRNVESHFAQLPSANIQRSTFDRSSSYKTSFNVGDLIPFYVDEVLPGDTFDVTTAKIVRSQTMLSPVMDNIFLDTYYFFVPNRLVWKHWKEFCGENTAGAWAPTVEYTIPTIAAPNGGFDTGTIADYMGLPVGVSWDGTEELAPSALPFRAYALICNEFFRDQNLSDPLLIPLDDAIQPGSNGYNNVYDVANGGRPFKAAKYHDYFTSALPAPQKGDAVGVPINFASDFMLPVHAVDYSIGPYAAEFYNEAMRFSLNGNVENSMLYTATGGAASVGEYDIVLTNGPAGVGRNLSPTNLFGQMPEGAEVESSGLTFNVNELRLAFAYQRYLEALARGGSRYTEMLLSLFGVKSPDARLQRPEYLGGNRVPINVNEVTNTTQLAEEGGWLGDLGGKSQTGDVNHDFIKSFTEHGYLIGVMVARYDHSYAQGLQKFWTRKTFTDFYNPKFANLGEVPIYQAEIYATDSITDEIAATNNFTKERVFGYQEIWADYRYRPNLVTGEMRPNVPNSLDWWHLADHYEVAPVLSDSWIREDKTNVDRVLAVTSEVSDQFWADVYIQNKCTRCMPMYSVPGLIDHF